MTPAWLAQILAAIRPLIPKGFVGQIEVNCFRGSVTNVNLKQSFKDTAALPSEPGPPDA